MSSILETLLSAVKTRLDGILGSPNYTYTVLSVQRWRHEWDGEEEIGNLFSSRPVILIQTASGTPETPSTGSVDLTSETVEIDIQFLLETSANDEDKINALADLKKALFQSFDGYTVGATLPRLAWRMVDEEGLTLDGIHATLTCIYSHDFGDPASRTG